MFVSIYLMIDIIQSSKFLQIIQCICNRFRNTFSSFLEWPRSFSSMQTMRVNINKQCWHFSDILSESIFYFLVQMQTNWSVSRKNLLAKCYVDELIFIMKSLDCIIRKGSTIFKELFSWSFWIMHIECKNIALF